MSRRTLILIIVLIGTVVALLAVALTPKKAPAPVPQQPSKAPFAQTTLRINMPTLASPSVVSSISAAKVYTTDVTIDTGSNKVTAVQLELVFFPTFITNVEIKPGPFFKNPVELLNKVDENGLISYALGIGMTGGSVGGVQGKGTVATITFEEIGPPGQMTQIYFLPKTLVTAEGISQSVAKSKIGVTFPIATGATGSSQPVYPR